MDATKAGYGLMMVGLLACRSTEVPLVEEGPMWVGGTANEATAADGTAPSEALPLPPPALDVPLETSRGYVGQVTSLAALVDPGETVHFLRSTQGVGQGPCPGALGGHCLEVVSPKHMGTAVADAQGVARTSLAIPAGAPVGQSVWFEAAVVRGAGGVDSVSSPAVEVVLEQPPYRASIDVDADLSDWLVDEHRFSDSSGRGEAFVSYDDELLYLAFAHPDLATGGPEHWTVVYLSTGAPGTTTGLLHNTQQPGLPFEADLAIRRKMDGSYDALEVYDGQAWVGQPFYLGTQGSMVAAQGEVLEVALPLELLDGTTQFEVVTMHLFEGSGFESTYGGIPSGALIDGYDPDVSDALLLDWMSPSSPVEQNP
jgi:hypothetical protein